VTYRKIKSLSKQTTAVIITLDILKNALSCLKATVVALVENQLLLQAAEKALGRSVVPVVAFAAHAATHGVSSQEFLIVTAGIL